MNRRNFITALAALSAAPHALAAQPLVEVHLNPG